jgi:hypothetical protein
VLKLPFIEKTYVGLELTAQNLFWVELNKLGNRIEWVGNGEIPINGSIEGAINLLKNQIANDSYFLGCVVPNMEKDLNIIDTPYFEDELDFEKWLKNYLTDLETGLDNSMVSTHVITLSEEERRILTQVNEIKEIERVSNLFQESDLPLLYLTNSSLVGGYSQIFNPDFVDGYSGLMITNKKEARLLIYHDGCIVNAHELGTNNEPDDLLASADSILKSEEITLEIEENAIACYHNLDSVNKYKSNRDFSELDPFLNKGNKLLPVQFANACGIAMKMCYPQLDQIEILSEEERAAAYFSNDKTELIRTTILLFAPLIFFVIGAFAIEKWTEPSLNEVSQVSALVADKLEMVSEERVQITDLKHEFDKLQTDYSATYITAPIFEIIAAATPDNMWLEELQINGNGPLIISQVEGTAQNSDSITRFIQAIRSKKDVEMVRLLSSEKQDMERIAFSLQIESKKL